MSRLIRFTFVFAGLNVIVAGLRADWVDGTGPSIVYGSCIGLIAVAAVES